MWPMSHALYPGLNNNEHRPRTAESHKTWYGNRRPSYASSRGTLESHSPVEDLGDLIQRSNHMFRTLSESDLGDRAMIDQGATGGHARQASCPDCLARVVSSASTQYHQSSVEDGRNTTVHGSEPSNGSIKPPSYQDQASSQHDATSKVDSLSKDVDLEPIMPQQTQEDGPRLERRAVSRNELPSDLTATEAVIAPQHPALTEFPPSPTKQADCFPNSSSDWSLHMVEHLEKQVEPNHSEDAQPKHGGSNDKTTEEEDEESSHLSGFALASVITSLSVAVFLVAMDVNVIATAIPHITGEFRSLDDIGWYGSAFLMAACACQIPYGRIYSLFAAKWVFLSAIVIFMAGSLIAALARSSSVLIFGRAVQGVGTSGILSGGLIIMSEVVPLRRRPVLGGVIGAMEGVAMISAPIIGGVLTDRLSWRWCFYINLPIGGVAMVVVLICLPVRKKSNPMVGTGFWEILRQLDVVGALALLPPIVCTLLALHFAGNGDSWGDKSTILLFVLAVVLFALFAYTQYRNANVAMLPWHVVKQRSVLAGFWFILCISSALVVVTYFLPLWFQSVRDTSAQQSGIAMIPTLVAVIVGVLGSGALVSAVGYYAPLMLASSALMPVGLGLLSTINPQTPRVALLAYPAIFGLGVGMGFQQPLMAIQTVLSQADIAAGTSIIVFGQTFGAALIIAAGESVFQKRLASHLAADLGLTDINTAELLGTGPSSLQALVTQDQLPDLINAVSNSITDTFYLALAMAALSIVGCLFIEWKSMKKVKKETEKP